MNRIPRTKCRDISDWLDDMAPASLAESWDNTGWMAGNPDNPVTGVLVCLDACEERIREAVGLNLNLIVCHHPPFFRKMTGVTADTREGRLAGLAWRTGVQIFSAHTNFDAAPGGLTDLLAAALDLRKVVSFPGGGAGTLATRARLGLLPEACDVVSFLRVLSEKLGCPAMRTIGTEPERIFRVIVQNGAYDSDLLPFFATGGADVLVTGDVKYHDALDLAEVGLFTVDAGHFHTEHVFVPALAERMAAAFPELPICSAGETDVYRMR